jgi:hypothetical protein
VSSAWTFIATSLAEQRIEQIRQDIGIAIDGGNLQTL